MNIRMKLVGKISKGFLITLVLMVFSMGTVHADVPAFPGAEGFGAKAKGGRGGKVIHVTNLEDKGTGSFRACAEAEGARTCVFDVGGTITVNAPRIKIINPYITIAGQTAPGGGITLRNNGKLNADDPLWIATHDVIVRYIRIRSGDYGQGNYATGEGKGNSLLIGEVQDGSEVNNVIIDHLSISWGYDSNLTIYGNNTHNITVQRMLNSEALHYSSHYYNNPDSYYQKKRYEKGLPYKKVDHSKSGGILGKSGGPGAYNVTMTDNLMAHNKARNFNLPAPKSRIDFVNNYIFDHGSQGTHVGDDRPDELPEANVIGNVYKHLVSSYTNRHPIGIEQTVKGKSYGKTGAAYIKDNIDNRFRTSSSQSEWDIADTGGSGKYGSVAQKYRKDSPFEITTPLTIIPSNQVVASVLADVGANKKLDGKGGWIDGMDAVDKRIINNAKTNKHQWINHPSDAGGYPKLAKGAAYKDTDQDGMPDAWEQLFGLDNNNAEDRNDDVDEDGYTNLEEYLNGTDPGVGEPQRDAVIEANPVIEADPVTEVDPVTEADPVDPDNATIDTARERGDHLQERIWFHPQFHRRAGKDEGGDGIRDGDGEKQNFDFMAESEIDFYGIRYELPWSLFERKEGEYFFDELDRLMKRANGDNKTGKKFKVYIVLHDKTWYDQNAVNDNWPLPGDKKGDTSQYFVKKTAKNGRKLDIRVARRWDSGIKSGYLSAIETLARRRTENSDYEQLEVISLGETSLAYVSTDILGGYGYPGAEWYRDYLIDIHQRAADIATRYQTGTSPLKIAINLNWIPGQPTRKPNEEWYQHDVLSAVKEVSNGVQAIEDVHANSQSKFYKTRVYDYTSDEQRVLPRNRVWAHISCDTKRNGQSAADNLEMARSLASNIVLRHRCDGISISNQEVPSASKPGRKGSTFQEYVRLLTAENSKAYQQDTNGIVSFEAEGFHKNTKRGENTDPDPVTEPDPIGDDGDSGGGDSSGGDSGGDNNNGAGDSASSTQSSSNNDSSSNVHRWEDLLDEMTGFAKAATTTGGAGGQVVWVTNLNDSGPGSLREAVTSKGKSWIRFKLSGMIKLDSSLSIARDKTIDGRGQEITLKGGRLWINKHSNGAENVIIHNIKIEDVPVDGITVLGSDRVWIDHVSFANAGDEHMGVGVGTKNVTISWCKFENPRSGNYALLLGTSTQYTQDRGLRVTVHHNYFNSINERSPRLRYGKAHTYNNYIYDWTWYGAVASQEGQLYSEGNIYEKGPSANTSNAIRGVAHGEPKTGYAVSEGDMLLEGAIRDGNVAIGSSSNKVFNPREFYSYSAESASMALRDRIKSGAGWQRVVVDK